MPLNDRELFAIASLKDDEGYRQSMYKCTAGKLTIGYGCNLEAGLSKYAAEELLKAQVSELIGQINFAFPEWTDWFPKPVNQAAFINMCYQLGIAGVKRFKKAIQSLEEGRLEDAKKEFANSKWRLKDTPDRAKCTINNLFTE